MASAPLRESMWFSLQVTQQHLSSLTWVLFLALPTAQYTWPATKSLLTIYLAADAVVDDRPFVRSVMAVYSILHSRIGQQATTTTTTTTTTGGTQLSERLIDWYHSSAV